jgi:hypothetical protein
MRGLSYRIEKPV